MKKLFQLSTSPCSFSVHFLKLPLTACAALSLLFTLAFPVGAQGRTVGPDAGGYTATDVVYPFEDISSTGTRVLAGADDVSTTVPIGFNFQFYGTDYSSLSFSSNGLISFGAAITTLSLPDLSISNFSYPVIAVLCDDWQFFQSGADAVYYQVIGAPGSRRLIIQWNKAFGYRSSPSSVVFEATLYEGSNEIRFNYLDVNSGDFRGGGANSTIGIADANGATAGKAMSWSHLTASITDGSSILFTTSRIASASTAAGAVGVAFGGYTITATGAPASFGASGLPPGLGVDTATGAISGTPTAEGIFAATITATNSYGTASAALTFTIAPPPPVATSGTASGTVGDDFTAAITATNTPTSYGATGLPTGLSVNPTTGAISGTPIAAGPFTATITATNAGGTGSATLAFTIAKGAAKVTLGHLAAIYDGGAKPATAATSPAVSSVTFTYNGSATIPTSPGSYSVIGTIDDANYTGHTSGTLWIVPGSIRGGTAFSTQIPALLEARDSASYELGMKFQTDVFGQVNAIRYWKTPSETGNHVGHIWSATGTLLAVVTFANETAYGWQEQPLALPLSITAGTTYVVSVNSIYYPYTDFGLASPIVNGHVSSVADGANGLLGTPGTFPTLSYHSANYFRDIAFTPAPAPTVASNFSVVSDWKTAFKGEFQVANPGSDQVETWTMLVQFIDHQITQMWGASYDLVSTTTDPAGRTIYTYKLTPPDWNARIASGASNTIGFLGAAGNVLPGDVTVVSVDQVTVSSAETVTYVLPNAKVVVDKSKDWQSGATMTFKITNTGTETISGWRLLLDFTRPIASIWNATPHSTGGTGLSIDATDYAWHKDIKSGATVEFGLIAARGAITELPLVLDVTENLMRASRGRATLAAPQSIAIGTSSTRFRMAVLGAGVKRISVTPERGAVASVTGKKWSILTVAHVAPGRTKMVVTAMLGNGQTITKTITVIRR